MKAQNLLFLLLITISLLGCSNPKEVLVNDENAKENVDKIKAGLDFPTAEKFEKAYKDVLLFDALGENGDFIIINVYSKKFEYLTLGDILDKVNSEKE